MRIVWGVAMLGFLASCRTIQAPPKSISSAFYYWRSTFRLDSTEISALKMLHTQTLYTKFFDVAWDKLRGGAYPVASLSIDSEQVPNSLEVIPVVFLTEESIANTPDSSISRLSGNVAFLLHQLISRAAIAPHEIQFDCDWSERTRDRYFSFLTHIRRALPATISLSATIRLHQVKYRRTTGVPPVDRGMLMMYNMSNWRDVETRNSIFDDAEAQKYISFIPDYPLPLDLALPLFRWTLVYRNGHFLTILNNVGEELLTKPIFQHTKTHTFVALRDTTFFGAEIRRNELLRAELPSMDDVREIEDATIRGIRNSEVRVALYHLDSTVLSPYSHDSFRSLRTLFGSTP